VQSFKSFTLLFILTLVLAGCSSGGSSNNNDTDSFKVDAVFTDIWHQHQSFYEKWDFSPDIGIRFTVSATLSGLKGPDNLSGVYFRDKISGREWSLTHESCSIQNSNTYECILYSSVSLNRVNLKNWEIIAENKQGEVIYKDVEFLLPNGDAVIDEQFVYSTIYSGLKDNGIAALEAMTITENEIVFSTNPISQSFHIEFESTDSRAKNYGFVFYDGTTSINNIGEVKSNSPSIESMKIVQGQKIIIDIPWSEVTMYNNAEISDINGLHIKLLDEPIDWLNTGKWFNYISLSEFITISP
jgi:hypothetical protein